MSREAFYVGQRPHMPTVWIEKGIEQGWGSWYHRTVSKARDKWTVKEGGILMKSKLILTAAVLSAMAGGVHFLR